jgi:cytochrome b subunit of formate dehydrogenase
MDTNKLIFRITTSILALMYLGGGSRYFLEFQEMSDIFNTLQFPRWLHPLLGVTKFLAVISQRKSNSKLAKRMDVCRYLFQRNFGTYCPPND